MSIKSPKKILIFIFMSVFLFAGMVYSIDSYILKYGTRPYKKMGSVQDELIVKFKGVPDVGSSAIMTVSEDNASAILSRAKIKKITNTNAMGKVKVHSSHANTVDQPGIYKLTFNKNEDLYTIKKRLLKDPSVEYVEPNYIYQVFIEPNDPDYRYQWALVRIGAPYAWDVHRGDSSVVIAVIDTGVDYSHKDLASNIWVNADEVPDNGIDDDGNGYVDDVRGWDFVDVPASWSYPGEDGEGQDNDPMDFMGHGTHISGIAAGVTNNNIGLAGTSWNSKIMPIKAGYKAWDGNGYLDMISIIEAIYYAADNDADIINMSFGSIYESVMMSDAINYAYSKGCIMVASAGNVDGYDSQKPFYPAAYDHVIAVASIDRNDRISVWNMDAFSNFGSFVDICAPGTSILSSVPGNSYSYENGTSMAAAFVSGAAALIKSRNPSWTAEQVEQHLKASSDDIYAVNKDFLAGKLGAGCINVQKAMCDLKMEITYPRPNSILSDSAVIKGSARINDFKEYKIECSSYADPERWSLVGSVHKQPVENGLLEIWYVGDPQGQYHLKLTVINISGEAFSKIYGINFGVNGELSLTEAPKSGPNPYDPNSGNYQFYFDLQNASTVNVYVYNISGSLIWQHAGFCNPGPNQVFWNGIDGFGSKIGNGVYIYMLVTGDGGSKKVIGRGKIAVVRS